MTKETIIQIANQKNYKVDFSNNGIWDMIGIRMKTCYHWFIIYDDNTLEFDHTYSQNTGKVIKSIQHRINVKTSLGFYN
jgi:hypothetical protein